MEPRVLSSAQTVFLKYVWPAAICLLAPVIAAVLYAGAAPELGRAFHDPPMQEVVWAGWLVSAGAATWWGLRLKRGAVDDESIWISDYLQEIRLPLGAIAEVRENRWVKGHPIPLVLNADTPWGQDIRFLPKTRFFVPNFVSHPVVAELNELIFAARLTRRASPAALYPAVEPPAEADEFR